MSVFLFVSDIKVTTLAEGDPKGYLFNRYYAKMYERTLLFFLICSALPLILMLSIKQVDIKYSFFESLVYHNL